MREQRIEIDNWDDETRGDNELTVVETYKCTRCKSDFTVTSTLHNISQRYLEELKRRQADGLNPPFDNGYDYDWGKTRGYCGNCLDEWNEYLKTKNEEQEYLETECRKFLSKALKLYSPSMDEAQINHKIEQIMRDIVTWKIKEQK